MSEIGVCADLEQVEHGKAFSFHAEMIALDTVAMDFTLQGEVAAEAGERLAKMHLLSQTPEHAVRIGEQLEIARAHAKFASPQKIGGRRAIHLLRYDAFSADEFEKSLWKGTQIGLVRAWNPRRKSPFGYANEICGERLLVFADAGELGDIVPLGECLATQDADRQRQALAHLALKARHLQAESLLSKELIFRLLSHHGIRFVPNTEISGPELAFLDDSLVAQHRRRFDAVGTFDRANLCNGLYACQLHSSNL